MKSNVKILNLLTILLTSIASVNSMEELSEELNKGAIEKAQQLEVPKNPLRLSGDFKGGFSKIPMDELPHAATEVRLFRIMEGTTSTEQITFKVLRDLKEQIETTDPVLKYFKDELHNKIKEETLSDTEIITKII